MVLIIERCFIRADIKTSPNSCHVHIYLKKENRIVKRKMHIETLVKSSEKRWIMGPSKKFRWNLAWIKIYFVWKWEFYVAALWIRAVDFGKTEFKLISFPNHAQFPISIYSELYWITKPYLLILQTIVGIRGLYTSLQWLKSIQCTNIYIYLVVSNSLINLGLRDELSKMWI